MSMRLSSSACSGVPAENWLAIIGIIVLDAVTEQLEGVAPETVGEHVAREQVDVGLCRGAPTGRT